MCDLIRHSQSESWKSPCADSSTRVFYYCTPTSSRPSPQSASSSSGAYSDESVLGTSPHEDFTSFYISPLRCAEYVLRSSSPSTSISLFSRQCEPPPAVEPPRVLGAGGFGRVTLSSYNKKSVALKQVRGTGSTQQRLLGRELLAFLVPASPFVVSALGFTVTESCFHVMSELVDGGNLQSLLDSEDCLVENELKMDAIHQIASALAHCHSFSILHLDVKPSNVLFVKATRSFKLADFGCSMIGRREQVARGEGTVELLCCPDHERLVGGTIPYQAPEIFKKSGVCCRSDVYSLGICITPFFQLDRHFVVYTVVKNGTRPDIDLIGPPFAPFCELLPILWSPDALARPSSVEVLQMIANLCL
ncbi:hypothetical protein PRIPAC_73629 [Pristionchus pacificus]|uniref:non-specific serine/threonine protein kinase n=1 Tax=Pristionchus pacificus TaxID=54126 RepID=A0A2A6C6P7_PRIPA|nr:hypothetical protein PRIPAC_73629 [Pristionchus pacificus]|eukprot:PDM73855.1 protein kinase [Pristionchus pacificus]